MARNPFRAELADGSRIERAYRTEGGRRVGRGNWQWAVYDPDRRPQRKRINLRTKDRAAALHKATTLAQQRALGLYDPWAGTAPGVGTSFEDAVARYLEQKARTAAPATVEADRRHLGWLARVLPAACAVAHVEARHVEAVVNAPKRPARGSERPPSPASPETKKRRRATLQHFFAWAEGEGLCSTNPAAGVALPKMVAVRRDHVTPEEAAALLRAAAEAEAQFGAGGGREGWLADWVTFGLGTGLRPGEQRQLRWGAVRLAEAAVEVGKGHRVKTAGSRRVVPVAGEALAVLERLHAMRPTGCRGGPVFTGAYGGEVAVGYVTKRLQRLAVSVGVEKQLTAYALRHAYGTRMAAAGVPLLDLARLMGTSVRMIERHYAHYDPARGAAHVARVFGG